MESDDPAAADPAELRLALLALHVVAARDPFDRDSASWTILKLLPLFQIGEVLTAVDQADGEGMRRQAALRAVALPTGGAADRAPPQGFPAQRPAVFLRALGVGAGVEFFPPGGFFDKNFEFLGEGKGTWTLKYGNITEEIEYTNENFINQDYAIGYCKIETKNR